MWLNRTMIYLAEKTLKTCKNKKPNQNQTWMNNECFKEQNELKKLKKEFLDSTESLDRRQRYLYQKKKFKRLLYFTKKVSLILG